MYSTAITTYPFSYSKVCPTFRTAGGVAPTARANLGRESFADFFIPCAFSNGFVRKHCSEARPGRIKNGLGHPGFGQSCSVDVSYCDVIKLTNDAIREFVQGVPARIGDLGVNRLHKSFFVGSLGFPKFFFEFSIVAFVGNLFASGQCGSANPQRRDGLVRTPTTTASDSFLRAAKTVQVRKVCAFHVHILSIHDSIVKERESGAIPPRSEGRGFPHKLMIRKFASIAFINKL